jgi:hypothetical protein
MKGMDTSFWAIAGTQVFYVGGDYGPAGLYYGGEINYIGVGQGFAARGENPIEMRRDIIAWKLLKYNVEGNMAVHGTEFNWADVGFYSYSWYHSHFH